MNYPQNPTNLVQRAIAGENEAFDQLVKLHYSAVYRLALYLTNNDADAQDVTQQTFLSAFQNLRQLREEGKFSAWLKKITLNEYRTWRRQAFELVSYDDSLLAELRHIGSVRQAAPPDVECERRELYHQLLSAINSLSARNREAFKLYYLEEYSQKEVSEQLGISVSAVENRIMRAKKQLRQRLRRTIIMVDEKIAKDGIEIVPLWQSLQPTGHSKFGYFCFEIRPKIGALTTRFRWPTTHMTSFSNHNLEKLLIEFHFAYFKSRDKTQKNSGELFIQFQHIGFQHRGVRSISTKDESYQTTREGNSWDDFVQLHLTEPMKVNCWDEIRLFTVTDVEAEEDEIYWTISVAEGVREFWVWDAQNEYKKGNTAEAIKILEDGIRKFHQLLGVNADNGAIYYGLATAYALKNNPDDALSVLKKAIELDERYSQLAKTEEVFEALREWEDFQRLI